MEKDWKIVRNLVFLMAKKNCRIWDEIKGGKSRFGLPFQTVIHADK